MCNGITTPLPIQRDLTEDHQPTEQQSTEQYQPPKHQLINNSLLPYPDHLHTSTEQSANYQPELYTIPFPSSPQSVDQTLSMESCKRQVLIKKIVN